MCSKKDWTIIGIATVTFTCKSPKDFKTFHRCVRDKLNGYRSCLCGIQHPSWKLITTKWRDHLQRIQKKKIRLSIRAGQRVGAMHYLNLIDTYEFDSNWDEYIERLAHFFSANKITDKDKRKSILLTVWYCISSCYFPAHDGYDF